MEKHKIVIRVNEITIEVLRVMRSKLSCTNGEVLDKLTSEDLDERDEATAVLAGLMQPKKRTTYVPTPELLSGDQPEE